jgi:hypothetical protein
MTITSLIIEIIGCFKTENVDPLPVVVATVVVAAIAA